MLVKGTITKDQKRSVAEIISGRVEIGQDFLVLFRLNLINCNLEII
jgi:hypothetical protein